METFFARAASFAGILAAAASIANADVVNLPAKFDNSMFSEDGTLSSGIGEYLFCGWTRTSAERRALLSFDVSGIPAGSTITAVDLTLNISQAAPLTPPTTVFAHRVLGAWGEGASDSGTPGGGGILAAAGDVTWTMRVFPGTAWATDGGDFAPGASGSAAAGDSGPFTIASTPGLVADVQGWLDGTTTNAGWILIAPSVGANARRFDSRENLIPGNRPVLTVTFSPPSSACPADLDNGSGTGTTDGGVDINDLLYFLVQFEAGNAHADLDNGSGTGTPDSGVDINDLLYFLVHFEGGC
jgi:hypothetical protein